MPDPELDAAMRCGRWPARARRGLYLLTPDWADEGLLLARLEQALSGGPALVQYRNKRLTDVRMRRAQALRVRALCRDAGVPFIVNDDVELALDVDADGLHAGRDDGDPATLRAALGPQRILGVSCYDDWSRAATAVASGADYVAFGAMFASSTKPGAVRAPLELVRCAHAELDLPVATIGGITLENAPALVAAGADLLAVISDVFEAADPAARVAAYRHLYLDRDDFAPELDPGAS